MAYPVKLETLMQKARQRANLETQPGSTDDFISDEELISELNTSGAEWWDLVRTASWNGTMYRRRQNFQTVPLVSSGFSNPPPGAYYPLPQNFLHLISVDISISQTLVITAQPFQEEQRNMFKFYPIGAWIWNQPIYYQIQEQNIVFIPGPIGTFNVQVNYCPTWSQLNQPEDTFDSINSWEEWIVLDTAIKILIKDGQMDMISVLMARLDKQTARIKAMVPKRDMQTAEMIHEYGDPDFIGTY